MKLSETTKEVIALAEAIRDYWDTELPKRHPDYPFVHPGEDSGPPPPEEAKLKELLARQSEDVIYKLAMIMSLGQGYYGTDDLADRFQEMKDKYGTPDWAITMMMGHAALADYLKDGLDELNKNGIDVDHLTFMPVHSGS